MKINMNEWVASLKGAGEKKPLPILSFPTVSLLGVSVRELISSSALQAKGMKAVAQRNGQLYGSVGGGRVLRRVCGCK